MIYNVGRGANNAENVNYDNTDSGLEATNVQDGIDEINTNLGDVSQVTSQNYPSISSLLKFYMDNGYLPNPQNLPLIPTLTGNTGSNGSVIQDHMNGIAFPAPDGYGESGKAYYAFDGNGNTATVHSAENVTGYIGYAFTNAVKVNSVKAKISNYAPEDNFTVKFQYYNESTNQWVDIDSKQVTGHSHTGTYGDYVFTNSNPVSAKQYRLYSPTLKTAYHGIYYIEIQMYGASD